MVTTKFCQGISDISDTYMGFILDQWGVLHDGHKAYDGVVECLRELRGRRKTIVMLSNSALRADVISGQLEDMGILPEFYDSIVSSGEMIASGLMQQNEGIFKNIGKRCYLFGDGEAEDIFAGTDIELVEDVKKADFIMIAGSDGPALHEDQYVPVLKEGVRRGIKAICINPDSHALLGANYLMGPGLIARRYQDFGGVVHYIGKPHGLIFRHCIRIMQQAEVYPSQTVMIGDTMAHDIMGAHYSNIDTCLVKMGMHAGIFRTCVMPAEVDRTLDVLITHYNHVRPRYLVDRFEWGKALPDRKHKVHKKHVRRAKPVEAEAVKEPAKPKATKTKKKTVVVEDRPKIKKRVTPRKLKTST